jgi:hypothetical protein
MFRTVYFIECPSFSVEPHLFNIYGRSSAAIKMQQEIEAGYDGQLFRSLPPCLGLVDAAFMVVAADMNKK